MNLQNSNAENATFAQVERINQKQNNHLANEFQT